MLELFAAVAVAAQEPADCTDIDRASIAVATQPARQGASLRLYASTGLHGMNALDASCLTDWKTSDPAISVSPDRKVVLISPKARPGTLATVSARLGERRLETRFRVVGATEPSLVGFWSQQTVDCGAGAQPEQPLRELRFDPVGGFSVTFVPFETYKDYWGEARFEAASGRLAMTVEKANRSSLGAVDLEGEAQLDGPDRLILQGVYFGGLPTPPSASCRYVFSRG